MSIAARSAGGCDGVPARCGRGCAKSLRRCPHDGAGKMAPPEFRARRRPCGVAWDAAPKQPRFNKAAAIIRGLICGEQSWFNQLRRACRHADADTHHASARTLSASPPPAPIPAPGRAPMHGRTHIHLHPPTHGRKPDAHAPARTHARTHRSRVPAHEHVHTAHACPRTRTFTPRTRSRAHAQACTRAQVHVHASVGRWVRALRS